VTEEDLLTKDSIVQLQVNGVAQQQAKQNAVHVTVWE
jgi:hypothetical protein